MPTNEERANTAHRACVVFAEKSGQSMNRELDDICADLMTNILHLIDEFGMDTEQLMARARLNYEYETEEED